MDEEDNRIEIIFQASKKELQKGKEIQKPEWESVLSDKTTDEFILTEGKQERNDKKEVVSSIELPKKNDKKNLDSEMVVSKKEVIEKEIKLEGHLQKEPEIDYGEKKYTGQPITLDFYETDVKNVFRIIQHVSGLNFAIDKDVTGKVTMTLKQPVPWDQVLDLILKMNSLGKHQEGNIVRIAKMSTLQAEEERKRELLKAKKDLLSQQKEVAPLFTEYLLINYSDATSEIQPHLDKIVTKRGSLTVDQRNNQIILTETEENIKKAREIIEKIDKITPQVVIEARIVEASLNFTKDIGTQWNVHTNTNPAIVGKDAPYASIYKDALGGSYGYNINMNTDAVNNEGGAIGINFARITGTPFILNAQLKAMETERKGKIVSSPKVVTLDNKTASIKQGFQYPYTSYKDGVSTTEFKDIELLLDVTPHVTADNKISMKVLIDKKDLYLMTEVGPAVQTKKVETELLVNDGDTIVIGGIIQQSSNQTDVGVPFLRKIPLIGWLFKTEDKAKIKNELLIFLTPRIVELEQGRF
jgi:type IV pilus assembly protein PilQ